MKKKATLITMLLALLSLHRKAVWAATGRLLDHGFRIRQNSNSVRLEEVSFLAPWKSKYAVSTTLLPADYDYSMLTDLSWMGTPLVGYEFVLLDNGCVYEVPARGSDAYNKALHKAMLTAIRAALLVGYEVNAAAVKENKEKAAYGRKLNEELRLRDWTNEMIAAWWSLRFKKGRDILWFESLVRNAKSNKLQFQQALGCRYGDDIDSFGWYVGNDFQDTKDILKAVSAATGLKARKPAEVDERLEGLPGADNENDLGRVWSF